MYVMGVKVPRLGSIQDRILKQHFSKEAQKEAKKTQLVAMYTANSVSVDASAADEWNSRIKKIWNQYLALEYGVEVTAETEKELQMTEYYMKNIKTLKAKLIVKNKQLLVTGLESILDIKPPSSQKT